MKNTTFAKDSGAIAVVLDAFKENVGSCKAESCLMYPTLSGGHMTSDLLKVMGL